MYYVPTYVLHSPPTARIDRRLSVLGFKHLVFVHVKASLKGRFERGRCLADPRHVKASLKARFERGHCLAVGRDAVSSPPRVHAGYLKAVWLKILGPVFLGFRPKIDAGTPLDRPGLPRTSICTKHQPRGPSLRPLRGTPKLPPDFEVEGS